MDFVTCELLRHMLVLATRLLALILAVRFQDVDNDLLGVM